jgi:hypothetical protein
LAPVRIKKEVPTFSAYAEEFMRSYAVANNKPSEQEAKACILRNHLIPAFGTMSLNEIKTHPIEVLKAALLAEGKSRKRVNNVLACRGKMLRYAHEVELIDSVPRISQAPAAEVDFLRSRSSRDSSRR